MNSLYDNSRYDWEKHQEDEYNLRQALKQYIEVYGTVSAAHVLRDAAHEKVVINNPIRTIKAGWDSIKQLVNPDEEPF